MSGLLPFSIFSFFFFFFFFFLARYPTFNSPVASIDVFVTLATICYYLRIYDIYIYGSTVYGTRYSVLVLVLASVLVLVLVIVTIVIVKIVIVIVIATFNG